MADQYLILFSIINILFFLVLHIIIFRYIESSQVMKWIVNFALIQGLIGIIVSTLWQKIIYQRAWENILLLDFIFLLIFWGFIISYVLSLFGITITSIRIQLLSLICARQQEGLSYSELIKKYNKRSIVKTRLARLIGAGEISSSGGVYQIAKPFSLFLWHTYLLVIMHKLLHQTS